MHGIRMGNFLLDKDIPITIVLFIWYRIMLCHNRFVKSKTNKYYSKSDEIHLGLGVT